MDPARSTVRLQARSRQRRAVATTLAVLVVGAAGAILWLAEDAWMTVGAEYAVHDAGYGEMRVRRAVVQSHCPLGQGTFVFIAQGGRRQAEGEGYACVDLLGRGILIERPIAKSETIDWHD